MNDKYAHWVFGGIGFNVTNAIAVLFSAVLVFLLCYALSRHLTLRPNKAQNVLEMLIEFTNGIVKTSLPGAEGRPLGLYAFVLFLFLWVSNQIGLFLQIKYNGITYLKSPTTDPMITMTLAMMSLLIAHGYAIHRNGFKNYLGTYTKPYKLMAPVNFFEELTNFLTLSLRLYGNIFAGEVLINLLIVMANYFRPFGFVIVIPLTMIWQAFSVFIGSIQAYIFVTLSSVYISRKLGSE